MRVEMVDGVGEWCAWWRHSIVSRRIYKCKEVGKVRCFREEDTLYNTEYTPEWLQSLSSKRGGQAHLLECFGLLNNEGKSRHSHIRRK